MMINLDGLMIHKNDYTQTGFIYNNIVDWYSGSSTKSTPRARPSSDGSFDTNRFYYNDLVVSISGHYINYDPTQVARAKSQLAGKKKGGRSVAIAVYDAVGVTSRTGKIAKVSIPHSADPYSFSYTIDILCVDPKRYGDLRVLTTSLAVGGGGLSFPLQFPLTFAGGGSTGRLALTNFGTADAPVLFEVSGGLDLGFSITYVETGQVIRVDRPIPIGSVVYLNSKNGSVSIDKQSSLTGYLTRSDWFFIEPGETATIQFASIGSSQGDPTLTARIADTYE